MAARLNARHSEMIRDKIRASQLVNRLEDHVLGEVDLSATQVTAALGLLRKCVPDVTESKTDLNVNGSLIDALAGLTRGRQGGDPPVA